MPPTSKERVGRLGASGLPDRDNPFAWKRAVRQGRAGALALLHNLTDDEVVRYMAVARDQVMAEERHTAIKVASAIVGTVLVIGSVIHGARLGFARPVLATLGFGLVMVYWPWRVMKCRELWLKHFEAARAEQARRQSPG